ncbi:hypothetical protein OY671_012952, partial [Metschnikowia pulcherrima]
HFLERRIARESLEDSAFGGRHPFSPLAIRNIRDTAADQAMAAGHAHQPHFADQVLAERVTVHPFHHQWLAIQGTLDVFAGAFSGRTAVRLQRRAQVDRPHSKQALPVQSEEPFRIFIDVDKALGVNIK